MLSFPPGEEPQSDQNETSHIGSSPAKYILGKVGPLGPWPVSGFPSAASCCLQQEQSPTTQILHCAGSVLELYVLV